MELLDRVKLLIDGKGMTVAELERRAGLGCGTIRKWDKSFPSVDKVQRVAKVLNTSIDYLITGVENSKKHSALEREFISLTDAQKNIVFNIIKEFNENERRKL